LAVLGYPGFAHLAVYFESELDHPNVFHPTELILWAISRDVLDVRLLEGLPWLIAAYAVNIRLAKTDQWRTETKRSEPAWIFSLSGSSTYGIEAVLCQFQSTFAAEKISSTVTKDSATARTDIDGGVEWPRLAGLDADKSAP
jgi:hypothetical protein